MRNTSNARRRLGSERGAILIQVAISILALTAFSAFVLDYGVMWVSRREAQNAADAGALAGAVARAFDDPADPPASGGVAAQAATQGALLNLTAGTQLATAFGTAPTVNVSWACPASAFGGTAGKGCVQVDVYLNGENGSGTLPTFFAPLIGVTQQGVKATATAQATGANATDCLRPWAVADKWIEMNPAPGPFTTTSVFNRYQLTGNQKGTLLNPADEYNDPWSQSPSGFTVANDLGQQIVLKDGNPGSSNPIQPGWFMPLAVPRADGTSSAGGADYRANIATCNGLDVALGDFVPTETGALIGPTNQGTTVLLNQDLSATWNSSTKAVDHSCAPGICGDGQYHSISPRVVDLAVYNPDLFQQWNATNTWSACPTGGQCVEIVNFIGFFVASIAGNGDVTGYLLKYPGTLKPGATGPAAGMAFNTVITLVR